MPSFSSARLTNIPDLKELEVNLKSAKVCGNAADLNLNSLLEVSYWVSYEQVVLGKLTLQNLLIQLKKFDFCWLSTKFVEFTSLIISYSITTNRENFKYGLERLLSFFTLENFEYSAIRLNYYGIRLVSLTCD